MDPVTLFVSALIAGAASAAQDTASNVVKDAYTSLKTLLQNRYQGKRSAETALAEFVNSLFGLAA
jgi:ABC-type transporter MlaC component